MYKALFLKMLFGVSSFIIQTEHSILTHSQSVLIRIEDTVTQKTMMWFGIQFDDEPWNMHLIKDDPVVRSKLNCYLTTFKK